MAKHTEEDIKKAFLQLLGEKPLSKITVRDIVERCGINRNSFYYHYQDIPTLAESVILESADRIVEQYTTVDSLETALTAVVKFAEENRRVVMHLYRSSKRDLYEMYLWRVCDYVVGAFWKNVAAGRDIDPADQELLLRFFRAQGFGMVMDWMNANMRDEDIYEKIHRLCQLWAGSVEELFRKLDRQGGGPEKKS